MKIASNTGSIIYQASMLNTKCSITAGISSIQLTLSNDQSYWYASIISSMKKQTAAPIGYIIYYCLKSQWWFMMLHLS